MHETVKRSSRLGGLLILVVLGLFGASSSSANEYRAELVSETECCPARLVFKVSGSRFDEPRAIELEARVEKFHSASVYAGKRLIVEGELRYGGTIVVVANLDTLQQEHVFWTYGHALSASRRYLIYETHYPRLGGFNKTLVVLYDLEKTPEENLVGIVASDRFPRTVGRPLFPMRNAAEGSLLIENSSPRFSTSAFSFSSTEESVAFFVSPRAAGDDSREPMQLVVVGPLSDASRVPLWSQVVDFNDFALAGGSSDQGGFAWAGIERLVWEDDALVAIPNSIHDGELPPRIRFLLPGAALDKAE